MRGVFRAVINCSWKSVGNENELSVELVIIIYIYLFSS